MTNKSNFDNDIYCLNSWRSLPKGVWRRLSIFWLRGPLGVSTVSEACVCMCTRVPGCALWYLTHAPRRSLFRTDYIKHFPIEIQHQLCWVCVVWSCCNSTRGRSVSQSPQPAWSRRRAPLPNVLECSGEHMLLLKRNRQHLGEPTVVGSVCYCCTVFYKSQRLTHHTRTPSMRYPEEISFFQ